MASAILAMIKNLKNSGPVTRFSGLTRTERTGKP